MSELILLLSADLDVQAAFDYYEGCQEGRGMVFLRYLEAAFEQLRRFPESGSRFHRSYRRLLVARFPHGVFYTVESRGIIVAGVIETRKRSANASANAESPVENIRKAQRGPIP